LFEFPNLQLFQQDSSLIAGHAKSRSRMQSVSERTIIAIVTKRTQEAQYLGDKSGDGKTPRGCEVLRELIMRAPDHE
jgi:hypothetical protein